MRNTRAGTAATGDGGPVNHPDEHDALLLGLTLVAALTDAISYLGLDRVFPANMTGNTVLLGLGIASGDLPAATRSATALGAFLTGAVLAAVLLRRPGWSRASVGLLVGEMAALTALCGWWLALGRPSGAATYGLIGLAGLSMGAQSGLVSRLNVPGVSTTYITGTWTALSIALVDRLLHRRGPGRQRRPRHGVQLLVVTGYLAGAFAGGLGYRSWHGATPTEGWAPSKSSSPAAGGVPGPAQ
jgi:uncharacterized membrane protein YoaK (UPF0700 family)